MKILVTGGTGLVGRSLQQIMPNAIYVSSKDFDLTNLRHTELMFDRYSPDVVVHCAAIVSGITENIARPCDHFEHNVFMNTNIINFARRCNVKRLIAILSTCAYPDVASAYPIKETQLHESVPAATNFSYGYSKRMVAVHIDACNKQHNTAYSYLIPCNLYGEFDKYGKNSHYVAALIKKIEETKIHDGDSITLFGDGTPLRQFLYAPDLAQIIKRCIETGITTNFNICSHECYTIDEIARIALKACEAEHLQIKYTNKHLNGQYRKDCDNGVLRQLLPDFKFTSLFDGIKKTYEHYSTNTKHRQ